MHKNSLCFPKALVSLWFGEFQYRDLSSQSQAKLIPGAPPEAWGFSVIASGLAPLTP